MSDFPSFDDLFRIGRDEVLARNSALTRAVVEREGTDANALVAGSAAVGDECIGQLAKVEAALFLESASGTALDRLLWDRYRLLRKGASPAVGEVYFSTTAPVGVGFTIPALTQLKTATGTAFQTTVDTVFPTGSSGPVRVSVQSLLSGLSQQARNGTITSIASTIGGAPAGLSVTNTTATAGAADEETDDSFRERGRSFYTTSRRGTLGAIVQGALAVPGIATASAYEEINSDGSYARVVSLVVSDTFTAQLVDDSATYQTQSRVILQNVAEGLLEYRSAGVQVTITLGSVIMQSVILALTYKAGFNVEAAAQSARSTVVSYVNALLPGQALRVANIASSIAVVPGVASASVLVPSGDIEVTSPVQVFRTSLGLVLIGVSGVA